MVTTHMEHCIHPIPDWSKASVSGSIMKGFCCTALGSMKEKKIIICISLQSKVHTEDILCIAVGHPNLMATSSYDGEVGKNFNGRHSL